MANESKKTPPRTESQPNIKPGDTSRPVSEPREEKPRKRKKGGG